MVNKALFIGGGSLGGGTLGSHDDRNQSESKTIKVRKGQDLTTFFCETCYRSVAFVDGGNNTVDS